jgi:hypothetical protein
MSLDCGQCGLAFDPRKPNGMYYDDEEYICAGADCGATNRIGIDDTCSVPPEAYVSRWICKHGKDDETECSACESAEAGE